MRRWQPGEGIALREIWDGRVWSAWPAIVVQDRPGELMTYIPPGATVRHAAGPDGRELRLYQPEWTFTDRVTRRPVLSFAWTDAEQATLAFWDERWRFAGWYVNLERPLGRTATTYDFIDHCLDVLVAADRSTWTWKDEDELEEAIRLGIFTAQDATRFREQGERAARRIVGGEPPFDRDWSSWRPDPGWEIPVLPGGWDAAGSGRAADPVS